jgi:hypothetical protein
MWDCGAVKVIIDQLDSKNRRKTTRTLPENHGFRGRVLFSRT